MAQNHVTVFVSRTGEAEVEAIDDIVEGRVESVDWVGTINGEEVTLRLRLSEVDDDQDEDEGMDARLEPDQGEHQ